MHARHRRDGRAEREGEQLHLHDRHADRRGGDFVFADGDPRAADRRVIEPLHEKDGEEEDQRGEDVARPGRCAAAPSEAG